MSVDYVQHQTYHVAREGNGYAILTPEGRKISDGFRRFEDAADVCSRMNTHAYSHRDFLDWMY